MFRYKDGQSPLLLGTPFFFTPTIPAVKVVTTVYAEHHAQLCLTKKWTLGYEVAIFMVKSKRHDIFRVYSVESALKACCNTARFFSS